MIISIFSIFLFFIPLFIYFYRCLIDLQFCSIYLFYIMVNSIFVVLSIICTATALPATFDIRYQPQVSLYGNFQPSSDYFCQAYSWAKQLTQIVSSRISIDMKQKIVLSTQHLVECISTESDTCKQSTIKDIETGIKYIQNEGLTEQSCYRDRLFQIPNKFCARKCWDGSSYTRKFKAIINQQTDRVKLLTAIGNGDALGFVIFKYYQSMNYYSPDHTDNMKDGGEFYSYGVAEIVGWKKAGEELTLRMGASGWGFKGYGYVSTSSKIIAKYYSVRMLGYQDIEATE